MIGGINKWLTLSSERIEIFASARDEMEAIVAKPNFHERLQ
jgi:hypothetical protein